MLKRLLGLCCAVALVSGLAVSILAGDGNASPVPEAPAVQVQEIEVEPPMTGIELEPEPEFFEAGALCGPDCTSHEDCADWCPPYRFCSFEKRCKGRCLCGY